MTCDDVQLQALDVAATLAGDLANASEDTRVNWGPIYDRFVEKAIVTGPYALDFLSIACEPLRDGQMLNLPIGEWLAAIFLRESTVDRELWICKNAYRWMDDSWSAKLLTKLQLPLAESYWKTEKARALMTRFDRHWDDDYASDFMDLRDYGSQLEKFAKKSPVSHVDRAFIFSLTTKSTPEIRLEWKPTFDLVKKYLPERINSAPKNVADIFNVERNESLMEWMKTLTADELRTLAHLADGGEAYPFHIENAFWHAHPAEEF